MSVLPAFMQNEDVTQETCPEKMDGVLVTALGTADQLDACTCAGTVRPCGLVAACAPPVSTTSSNGSAKSAAHPAVRTRIEDRIRRTSPWVLLRPSRGHASS